MPKERKIYRYINGEKIHHTISPKLGERCRTNKSIYYTLDFHVTPHLLRHTYITNLIHEGSIQRLFSIWLGTKTAR